MGIAIPPMPTSEVVSTPAGPTDQLGRQLADVITGDLQEFGAVQAAPRWPTPERALRRGDLAQLRQLEPQPARPRSSKALSVPMATAH